MITAARLALKWVNPYCRAILVAISITPSLQWLGDRSFSVYLLHPVVINGLESLNPKLSGFAQLPATGQLLAALAITLPILLVAAHLTYRYIELPGIAVGRCLAARPAVHS